ncbi:MAG TPA: isoprenylcysteine carboxylmethyltransferase family protein, partial [Gammaproteobacteria bacterium]|nr:isoprenylcysteine carboxylmethyltransferase family protein [Gammaproteobacteria bacterium]
QNEFAQSVVNIQDDRNQVLIDKGLYAVVRHPMYLGLLVWLFGMSLWLGSIATALFGNAILFLALLPRILIEEKTLAINLEGYEDYMDRVQSRIIPQIF